MNPLAKSKIACRSHFLPGGRRQIAFGCHSVQDVQVMSDEMRCRKPPKWLPFYALVIADEAAGDFLALLVDGSEICVEGPTKDAVVLALEHLLECLLALHRITSMPTPLNELMADHEIRQVLKREDVDLVAVYPGKPASNMLH